MTPSTTHPYGAPLAGFVHQHFSLSAKILNLFRQDLEQHLSCHLLKLEAETIAQKIEHLVLFENYLTQPLKTILRVSKKKEKVPFSYYLTFQEDSLGILPILPTNISLIG